MSNADFKTIKDRAIAEDLKNIQKIKPRIIKRIRKVEVLIDKIYFGFIKIKKDYEPFLSKEFKTKRSKTNSDYIVPGNIMIFFHVFYLIFQPLFFMFYFVINYILAFFLSIFGRISLKESRKKIKAKRLSRIDIDDFVNRLSDIFNDYFLLRRDLDWQNEINNIDMFFKKEYSFISFTNRLKGYIRKRDVAANHPSVGKSGYYIKDVYDFINKKFVENYWYLYNINKTLKNYRIMSFLRKYVFYTFLLYINLNKLSSILAIRYNQCRKLSIKYFKIINKKLK